MIKSIYIQRLRNAGFVQFFKHLISIAAKFDIQALQISEEYAKLKESFALSLRPSDKRLIKTSKSF